MKRIKTGINRLDEIIGGYPAGTSTLVTGASGTGKTIFCGQFLYKGVQQYDENGIFITLEARPQDLRNEMLSLGWDFKNYEDEGKLIIVDAASARSRLSSEEEYAMPRWLDVDSLVTEIYKLVVEIDAKRAVIDSLPALELRITDPSEIRQTIHRLSSLLKEIGVTSLLTTESSEKAMISRYGVEEFVCGGVIVLDFEEEGKDLKRTLRVLKMRGTQHTMRRLDFEIAKDGIALY